MTVTSTRERERERTASTGPRDRLTIVLLVVVAAAAVTFSATAFATGQSRPLWLVPIGLLAAAALVALAVGRFGAFVLTVLAVRTSLDAFKLGNGAALPDPAALLGLLFIGVAVVWLVADTRQAGHHGFSPVSRATLVFSGVAFLGVLTSPQPVASVIEWSRIFSVAVMLLVVERLAVGERERARVLGAAAVALVAPLVVASYQLASDTNLFDAGGYERIRGTFTHSNPLAAFLAVLVVVAFAVLFHDRSRTHRVVAGVALVAALPALYLTYTRAAWLAVLAGLVVVTLTLGRRALLGLLAAAVLVVVMVPGVTARFADLEESTTAGGQPANSLSWRVGYWTEALALSQDSPIVGIGLKQVAAETDEAKQPHNDFVRTYVELGLPGLLAFGYLMVVLLQQAWRAVQGVRETAPSLDRAIRAGFAGVAVGYVVMSLVMNLLSQAVVGIYFFALVGVTAAVLEGRDRSPG